MFMGSFMPPSQSWANDEEKKARALVLFEKGNTQYNLGHWQKAILFFKEAYEAYPAPAFLFNLGQSYRQADNCEQSLFFYKRYLDLEKKPKNLIETENHVIAQTEKCRLEKEALALKKEKAQNAQSTPPTKIQKAKEVTIKTSHSDSSGFFVDFFAGASLWKLGQEFNSPIRESFKIVVGYTFHRKSLHIKLGPQIGFIPFGFKQPLTEDTSESKNSSFFTLSLGSSLALKIHERLSLGLQAGFGVLAWSGISEPNIFIANGLEQNGPLLLAHIETGLHLGIHLHPKVTVLLVPIAISYSPRRNELIPSIDSLTSYQTLLGVGLRF